MMLVTYSGNAQTLASADWRQGVPVPVDGRANILQWPLADFLTYKTAGQKHAQVYPVTVTGLLPPYEPSKRFFDEKDRNPFKEILRRVAVDISGFDNFNDFLFQLGLHSYPSATDRGIYQIPMADGVPAHAPVGIGLVERNGANGFTFSCAACHTSNLFGKTVLGMTNRFPRANEFFVKFKQAAPVIDAGLFQKWTKASQAERELLEETLNNINRVQVKKPIVLGLDTSLAQVALSMNRRSKDEYSTPSSWFQTFPRRDPILDNNPADSKPAVWWNVKYKNRWLSDGSVISGNPIFTNIIWNEMGRGVDLKKLEAWLHDNSKIVDELTTAVFSSEAPRFTDFFPAEKIELDLARRGEVLFNQSCAKCHGHYDKAWNLPHADLLSAQDKLATVMVRPKEQTPVIDVGTDPYRRQGMKSLEQLNNLSISKRNGIVIETQKGYVPPPLVGIWARWPYFHNNSVPSLCALLTPSASRPQTYYAGEALDREKDFDADCNGYPLGVKTPAKWKQKDYFYDTRRKGMSNAGHDVNIFIKDGKEIFTAADKKALIRFMQTL